MKSYRIYLYLLSAVILTLSCTQRDKYVTINGYAQGGTYSVKFNLKTSDGMIRIKPEVMKDSIDNILKDIDNSLSGYNKNSILSRFNSGQSVKPDVFFTDIYKDAYEIFIQTGGYVDVASGPLFDLWGFGFKSGDFPDDKTVMEVKAVSGMNRLKKDITDALDSDGFLCGDSLLIEQGGIAPVLNYNAIAQGFSCDAVAEYLYSLGVKDMMVDIGEIFCDGNNPSGKQWSIGIDRPFDGNIEPGADIHGIFRVPEGRHGIVTSGNYRKYRIVDGKKYAHTIDPISGYPVTHSLLSATILAPDSMTADAYATYCMAIGLEKAKTVISENPDLEGCLIYDEDGVFKTWCSDGFKLETL